MRRDILVCQGGSSTRTETKNTAISPTGKLMKKIQRQSQVSVMKPPNVGPSTGATTVAIAVTPNAHPRFSDVNVSRTIDCWPGCRPPPKKPCSSRKTMSCGRLVAVPQRKEQTANIDRQIRKMALPSDHRAQPPGDRQHDTVGDEIGSNTSGIDL